jgi:hypothetical protein
MKDFSDVTDTGQLSPSISKVRKRPVEAKPPKRIIRDKNPLSNARTSVV